MMHELKTKSEYFQMSVQGLKRFEIRMNDRCFAIGDKVKLLEVDNSNSLTGSYCMVGEIKYIFYGGKYGLKKGYCILGL